MREAPFGKEKIIFEHIPKTAGMSLQDAFFRYYDLKNCYQKKNKVNIIPDKYKFAYGHRAAYSLINDSKYNYFTFLRDPYLTLISHFNHISRSILGFYPENHFINIRILKKDINSYIKEYKFKSYDNPFIRWLGGFYDVEFGKTNDFHLEKTIKIINEKFFYIGFVEEFERSLLEISKILKWKKPPIYFRENEGYSKLNLNNQNFIEEFKELNKFDYLLYDHFRQKFDQNCIINDSQISYFKEELKVIDLQRSRTFSMKKFMKNIIFSLFNL